MNSITLYERLPNVWRIRITTKDNTGLRKIRDLVFKGDRAAAEKRRDGLYKMYHIEPPKMQEPSLGTAPKLKPAKTAIIQNRTTPQPLGLTDEQLEIVLDRSFVIDPTLRSKFLAEVVDRLLPQECISNAEVERVCREVRHRMTTNGRLGSDETDKALNERLRV